MKSRNVYCRRVAGAFASVPPLCIAPQPFKTKAQKEVPYVLSGVEVEGDVLAPGEPTVGGGGPAELWEWAMSCGLDLLDFWRRVAQ